MCTEKILGMVIVKRANIMVETEVLYKEAIGNDAGNLECLLRSKMRPWITRLI